MNHSSSRPFQKDDNFNEKPEWIDTFLERRFFESCLIHRVRRNELNKYCVKCDMSACQYCVSLGPHKNHKLLKIYRHVYKDVVSLGAMEKYMDCSNIQPYKSNKRLVIALNPLPHCGAPINSDKRTCQICKRRLNDPNSYRYCSIACKVQAFSTKPPDSDADKPPQQQMRKRKGIPRRAPFF